MDEKTVIAGVNTPIDQYNNILEKRIPARHFDHMELFHVNEITHMDVNPSQIFSANTSLIPFVNHNDAVRAMIATNQHRQGIPLIKSDSPLV
jgi:DNA-directed RNA polymerase subunit beta